MRILVIEDQPLIGKAIENGLREEGFGVDWDTTLEEGGRLAKQFDYDTLIRALPV